MKKSVSISFLVVSLFIGACSTTPPSENSATISVSSSGRITFHGKDVSLNNLAENMKGCNSNTRITIEIPADASTGLIKAITQELASGNFRRIIFARPKKSVAVTKPKEGF